jgi:cold-inducible RNA-binding protein
LAVGLQGGEVAAAPRCPLGQWSGCDSDAPALNMSIASFNPFCVDKSEKIYDNNTVILFPTVSATCGALVGVIFRRYVKDLSKKIYVGNLSFDATEAQVNELFAQYGKVDSVTMINDRNSGRFRGFGFVEMEESAANAAIRGLNDTEVDGRMLRVNEARPRENRSGGNYNKHKSRKKNKFPYSGGGNY